jgi:hypothetical protein
MTKNSFLFRPLRLLISMATRAGFPHSTLDHGIQSTNGNITRIMALFADEAATYERNEIIDLIRSHNAPSPERHSLLELIKAREPS